MQRIFLPRICGCLLALVRILPRLVHMLALCIGRLPARMGSASAGVFVFSLVTGLALLCVGCIAKPGALAGDASRGLKMPERYDASLPAVPELREGLLELFADERLRGYVDRALEHNPDLQASAARLEEAGFDLRKAYAPLFPRMGAIADGARSQTFTNGVRSRANSYSAGLDVRWEIDVWGRVRSGLRASARDRDAVAADHAAAQESIAAQTMQAYFDLVAAAQFLDLSRRRLTSFEKSHQLVQRRFQVGTADLGDLDLARTDVENTRSELAENKDARDQAARQLAVLTGAYPDTAAAAISWPSLRRGVQAGLPSTLLLKRPDIDAAYQRIRAADARVTVAHRDLFPRFSLTASGGNRSSVLKDIADSDFRVWSVIGNLAVPLFDTGEREAEVGAAQARARQALAAYQATVLNALREVENALGSEPYLLRQEAATRKALGAARSAEERILRNYEAGLVEVLTLLDTQRRSFATEESLINIRALRYKNRVALALALGKGL